MSEAAEIFEPGQEFPDADARRRLGTLVGLDSERGRLEKALRLVFDPGSLDEWSERHHRKALPVVDHFRRRPPLFLLAGDVGTGKTALAETIGDPVARSLNIGITLFRLSLAARGTGLVGDMTRLIAGAFAQVSEVAAKVVKSKDGKPRAGFIMLIDEADALAQSREAVQMHHEDRAGVNALIRGIDDLALRQLPVAVLMCTNRLTAIDPAVRRRAADLLTFHRPTAEYRRQILNAALAPAGFTPAQIKDIVEATGETGDRPGFTFSDITQRYLPMLVLDAYPDAPLRFARAVELARATVPTPAFRDEAP